MLSVALEVQGLCRLYSPQPTVYFSVLYSSLSNSQDPEPSSHQEWETQMLTRTGKWQDRSSCMTKERGEDWGLEYASKWLPVLRPLAGEATGIRPESCSTWGGLAWGQKTEQWENVPKWTFAGRKKPKNCKDNGTGRCVGTKITLSNSLFWRLVAQSN